MIDITFVDADGGRHTVTAQAGQTVMQTAVAHGVPGIDADCGGCCVCATCHVYVDAQWRDVLDPPGEAEGQMLEFAVGVEPRRSRLSCQLVVSEALNGLVVRTPPTQR